MDIQEVTVPARNFEENTSGRGFVIHREVARKRGHTFDFFRKEGNLRRSLGRLSRAEHRAGEKEENCPHAADVSLDAPLRAALSLAMLKATPLLCTSNLKIDSGSGSTALRLSSCWSRWACLAGWHGLRARNPA